MLKTIGQLLNGSRKAIVAFVLTALIAYIARQGYSLDANAQEVLRAVFDGLLVGVSTWLIANK